MARLNYIRGNIRNLAIAFLCLLACSVNNVKGESTDVTAEQRRGTVGKPSVFEYTHTDKRTSGQAATEDSNNAARQKLKIHDFHSLTDNMIDFDNEEQITNALKLLVCQYKQQTLNLRVFLSESVLDQICSEKRLNSVSSYKDDWDIWNVIRSLVRGYNTKPKSIRKKRDVYNETEVIETDSESSAEELPEAESLIWTGPQQRLNMGSLSNNVPSMGNLLGQRLTNYQSRVTSKTSPSSPLLSRLQTLMMKKKFEQDSMSSSNNYGFLPNTNSNSRQHQSQQPYNTYPSSARFPEIPARPQPNYYPPTPFSSLGEAGANLLKLLNPLNLFRPYAPPQLPTANNQLPPNVNQPYVNPNHLRHSPNPAQPTAYEPRQPNWSFNRPVQGDDPLRGNEIGPGKIKYEVFRDNIKHQHGHEYLEDSPLRDDIYVGKDGNLYIKEEKDGRGVKSNFGNQNIESYYGRYEEQDIGNFNKYEDDYHELLKNHNMGEGIRGQIDYGEDFFSQDNDNFNLIDFQSANNEFSGNLESNNQSPESEGQEEGSSDWFPSPPRRINYPSYIYVPRQVVLSGVQRGRPIRPIIPSISATNLGFQGSNPQGTVAIPHSRQPSSHLNPTSYRKSSVYETLKALREKTSTQEGTRNYVNGHGFYPGNGFFETDFPTLFQMSPFKQAGEEELPTPLHQNGTSLAHAESMNKHITQIDR